MNKFRVEGTGSIYKDHNINKNAEVKNHNLKSKKVQSSIEIKNNNEIKENYTYAHLKGKNIKSIDLLKSELNESYSNLKKLINDLILKQNSVSKKIKVSGKITENAQKEISENGRFSPEILSDKIVEFAKNISGGDKSKFEKLKSAVIEGFEEAKNILGGELPEISKKTYDLVMEKLDDWKFE